MERLDSIAGNIFELSPTILDASVFCSYSHCELLLQTRTKFFISASLYNLLYEEYDKARVFNTLGQFVWRRLSYLPSEKLELRPYLEPYEFKRQYVNEIYRHYETSKLPLEVKQIILDQYSFLKEHSSMLLYTRRTAKHLHGWGITLLDATNKCYDRKRSFFWSIRGVRWILGTLLASGGIAQLSGNPLVDTIAAVGGIVLVLFDP